MRSRGPASGRNGPGSCARRGLTYRAIGSELGVSHVTVKKYLDRVEDRINRDIDKIALRILARDLVQLEHVQKEVMEAWELSKRNGKRVRKRQVKGQPDEVTVEVSEREGDPKFLGVAMAAIESRRKLVVDRDVLERLDELEAKFDGDGGGARPAEASRADRSGGT